MMPSSLRPLLAALTVLLAVGLTPLSAQTRYIERGVAAGNSPSTFITTDRIFSFTELQTDPDGPLRVETHNDGAGYSIGREGSALVKRRTSLADGIEMSVRSLTGTSAADGTAIPDTVTIGQTPSTHSYVLVENERIDVTAADSSAPTARLRIHAALGVTGNGIVSQNRIWSPVGKASLLVSGTIYRRSGNQRISDFSTAFAVELARSSEGPVTTVGRIFGQGYLGTTITPDYPGVGVAGGSGIWNELSNDGLGYIDLDVPNGSYVEFSVTCRTSAEVLNFSRPQSLAGAALANYDISATGRVWASAPLGGQAVGTLGTTLRNQSLATQPLIFTLPVDSEPVSLAATASSGLPVTTVLISGPATLSDSTLGLTGQRGRVSYEYRIPGDNDHYPAIFSRYIDVVGLPQTIDFPSISSRPADSPAFIPAATATSGLPVTFTVTGGPATTTDGRTVTLTGGTGTVYLLGRQLGDDTYEPTLAIERTFTVTAATGGASQTINFAALLNAEVGTGQLLSATATSGLPVTFTVVEGSATIGGINNNILSATVPGVVTVRATQAGGINNDITYAAATPVERSFTATAATTPDPIAQTITFPALPDVVFDPETPLYFLSATSDSGLTVAFEIVSGPATVSGSVITLSGEPGFVTVRATQPGDTSFLAAEPVERTFAVTTAAPKAADLVGAWLVDFDLDGRALAVFKADGTYYLAESGTADDDGQPGFETGTYTWTPATGVLTATTTFDQNGEWGLSHPFGTMRITVAGDVLRFEDGEFDVTFLDLVASSESALVGAWRFATGGGGEAIITFLPDGTYFHIERDTADDAGQSGMEYGLYSWDSTTGTFTSEALIDQNGEWGLSHPVGAFNITVTGDTLAFTDGPDSGTATRVSADSAPELLPQTVRFNAIANRTFNPVANTVTLTATSSVGLSASLITFAVSDGPATVSGNVLTVTGAGSITVTATHPGDASHGPASASRTFTVAKATQAITFTYPAKLVLGATPPAVAATASSGLPVEFSVSSPAMLEGDTLAFPLPGAFKITATQPGNANYLAAKPVVRTLAVSGPVLVLGNLRQTYTGTSREVSVSGVPSGFAPAVVTYSSRTYALSQTGPTDVGSYTVTATFGSIKKTGILTIEKAPLAVSFNNRVRLVATANPTFFEPIYTGFLDDDTEADLAPTRPVGGTKATIKSAEGDYPITFKGGLDKNYRYVPGAPATLHVLGFGGAYEALLVDGASTPVGKLTLAVSKNTLGYTGTLNLARETKAITVSSTAKSSGTTTLVSTEDFASATATWTRTATGPDALVLTFTVSADGTLTGSLDRNGELFATLAGGRFLYAPPAKTPIEWAGQHTLALHSAFVTFPANEGPFPRGSGVATAVVSSANGNLVLKGKLADGATLTATLKPWITTTEDGALDQVGYVAWILPYGTRAESFLAGALDLQPQPETVRFGADRRYIPSDAGLLTWKKAGNAKDKSYRDGFGPLSVSVSLDPWLPPVVAKPARGTTPPVIAITLPERLGLVNDNTTAVTLTISHGPDELDLGELESALPSTATLGATAAPTATNALTLTEFPTPLDNLTKWKLTSLNPATGAFTGSFILSDQVKPLPAKKTPRTVIFTGTLRQAPVDEGGVLVATGFFLVPDLVSKTAEQPSGEIRFSLP